MKYNFGKKISNDFIKSKLDWNSLKYINTAKRLAHISTTYQTKCYLCNSKRSKKQYTIYGINYNKCLNCSHVYTNKRLSEKQLIKYYSEDENYSTNTYANKKLINLRKKTFQPKINFIKKFVKGKNWLDVGAADGMCVHIALKSGFYSEGIEISEHSRKFAKEIHDIELFPNSLELFEKSNKTKWNVISLFGVLEHLTDPIHALKISHKLLDDDGIVAIEVPNFEAISSYIQGHDGIADRHLVPYSHIMLFTENSMNYALRKTGFEPIAYWYYGMDMIELLKFISKKDENIKNSKLFSSLIDMVNKFQKTIDEEKLSDFFLVIGRKSNKYSKTMKKK